MTGITPKRILEVSFLIISHVFHIPRLSGLSFLRATARLNHSVGFYLPSNDANGGDTGIISLKLMVL